MFCLFSSTHNRCSQGTKSLKFQSCRPLLSKAVAEGSDWDLDNICSISWLKYDSKIIRNAKCQILKIKNNVSKSPEILFFFHLIKFVVRPLPPSPIEDLNVVQIFCVATWTTEKNTSVTLKPCFKNTSRRVL